MERIDYAPLREMLADRAARACIDALRADLTRKAVARASTDEERHQNLLMLWGLDALMVKISNSIPEREQAQ